MTTQQRHQRILAHGEHSGHCHVITGNIQFNAKGQIIVGEDSNAVLKHILEKDWLEKEEQVWTGEHKDITLTPGTYEFVQQVVFDPLTNRIQAARD